MKSFSFGGKTYELDDQNFLINFDNWDENFANLMAPVLNIPDGLTTDHWKVIYYIRDTYKKTGTCPLVYETCKANELRTRKFRELFPTGYHRGACLLAGVPVIEQWLTCYGEAEETKGEKPRPSRKVKVYRIDGFGFLVDPSEWDEDFATNRAAELHIKGGLTTKHWQIIYFMRDSYKKTKTLPTVFDTCVENEVEMEDLERLFPTGYHRGAVKIAGLPHP
jgi:tRNA 2-thiouridine synthesizing protein E